MALYKLSKSQYMRGLQCLKRLWLYNHRKDLQDPASPALQMIFDQGHAVGELAWQAFPGGKLIEAAYNQIPEALSATQEALRSGAKILYEAAFIAGDILVRPDILTRNPNGSWDMLEVKSATQADEVYVEDVAVQKFVLEQAGLKIRKARLVLVDSSYIRKGPIDPPAFFRLEDLTKEAEERKNNIQQHIGIFLKTIESKNEPAIGIGPHCSDPYDCDFQNYCWAHVPECSIFNIPRLSYDKKRELISSKILTIEQVPDDFPLSDNQCRHVQVIKSGKTCVDHDAISRLLGTLKYPLYFLDFETINPAIPPYDGLRPFQQIVFQASLHVQKKPNSKPEHFEYLGDGKQDPRSGAVNFLIKNIGQAGSVVVFNKSFEVARIKELAKAFSKNAAQLLAINERVWDLAEPFQKGFYMHPGFRCSYSIKNVLPVLIPGMSYDGMEVANGSDAQVAYANLMSGKLPVAEHNKRSAALKRYCGQDTMAMVKILETLKRH